MKHDIRDVIIGVVIGIIVAVTTCQLIYDIIDYNAKKYDVETVQMLKPMEPSYADEPCMAIPMSMVSDTYMNIDSVVIQEPVQEPVVEEYVTEYDTQYNVIFEWQKYGGDFGVEQLKVLQKYCDKYNVPVKLMLAIISHESGFESDSKSSDSSASGYCQIIRGTAEDIYENDLGYGVYDTYNHEYTMTTNWELNIEIGCQLMRNNYEECYNSWEHAIYAYHGHPDNEKNIEYFWIINERLYEFFNISVCDLA